MRSLKMAAGLLLAVAAFFCLEQSAADEGMWTFDRLPKKLLKEKYGFELTDKWAQHVQLASVRFNNGGSGSFVSPNGLVMTNHHVGLDVIHKLSSAESDYVRDGFLALRRDEEIRCQDLELNQLISITDVTERVRLAATKKTAEESAKARRAEISRIEKEESDRTGLRCDVESFYGGDQFCVYRYKKYTDVRFVFAPEESVAAFGGDRDNFCYPRWCLDCAFFRVYEDGKPAKTPEYFAWSRDGAKKDELVFVSGNPGSTGRYETAIACRFNRDLFYPAVLKLVKSNLSGLEAYAKRGAEEKRQAADAIASWANSLKAYTGYLQGLEEGRVMKKIEARDAMLLHRAGDERAAVQAAYNEVEEAFRNYKQFARQRLFSRLEGRLAQMARQMVTLVRQLELPNEERKAPYRESSLESTELGLFSSAPIYIDLELAALHSGLTLAHRELGKKDLFVAACLGQSSSETVLTALKNTRVGDAAFRRQLVKGGVKAVEASKDPIIQLILAADPVIEGLAKRREVEFFQLFREAEAKLSELRRRIIGRQGAPDANFTLRLSFGVVKGYELGTTDVPHTTSAWGLFERHHCMEGVDPYSLPKTWQKARTKIDLDTHFNFVCTADIIGGNSGSPVLNRRAEIVGLIFDGNIQSLSNRFVFDEKVARSVSVDSEIIIEALRQVYGASGLADELEGRKTFR
ncbi:MAG: S46 family peptidase [Planctomycetota bacterium]